MQPHNFASMASGHATNATGACNSMKARQCGGYPGSLKLGEAIQAAFPKACQSMMQHPHGARYLREYNQIGHVPESAQAAGISSLQGSSSQGMWTVCKCNTCWPQAQVFQDTS